MANFTIYNSVNTTLYGVVTVADSGHIEIVSDGYKLSYWGFGFTYNQYAQVTGGILQRTNLTYNGVLQYEFTGLNHSASYVYYLMNSGGDVLAFLLNGNDVITGTPLNDILYGYTGADTLRGGLGDDTYILNTLDGGVDQIVELAGGGSDTVIADADYTLTDNVENLTLRDGSARSGTGNALANYIQGNSSPNLLVGGAGDDTLTGGAFDSSFSGDNDTLVGGSGNDVYLVNDSTDVVTELAGEGTDTVRSYVTFILPGFVENLVLQGSLAIDGNGNALANRIDGNDANNILTSGGGADTLVGGLGDDTYVLSDGLSTIIDTGGLDTVVSSSDGYTLTAVEIENLTLAGPAITGYGNDYANVLKGSALNNVLYGMGGNDTLMGGGGSDTLVGGYGDDVYVLDSASVTLIEQADGGMDTVRSSVSITLAFGFERLELAAGTLALNGTGNASANWIVGNDGNNVLDGGGGADTLVGGNGSDTYILDNVNDVVEDNGWQGVDQILSSVTYDLRLAPQIENLTLTGVNDINATGSNDYYAFNTLTGNSGNNTLTLLQRGGAYGGAGNDHLVGSGNGDTLDGGTGADTMEGGYGSDTYWVDNVGDVVIDSGFRDYYADLSNWIFSSVSYTAPEGVNYMTLVGDQPINGKGSTGLLELRGNDAANVLEGVNTMYGMGGDDTLILNGLTGVIGAAAAWGGKGDDVYKVAAKAAGYSPYGDPYIGELPNEGIDTVISLRDWTLHTNVENLTLTGGIFGTGNDLNNLIIGNAGNNVLDGLAGGDTLVGGLGDDTYIVDNVGDVITEFAGQGYDTISVSTAISYSIAGQDVEVLTFATHSNVLGLVGIGNDLDNVITSNAMGYALYGGVGDDTITGNSAFGEDGDDKLQGTNLADVLDGGKGNDELAGGAGNDLLLGGDGDDILDGGSGLDTISGGTGNDSLVMYHPSTYDPNLSDPFAGSYGPAIVSGGAGADAFVYGFDGGHFNVDLTSAIAVFSPVSRPDRITDFNIAEGDRIATKITNGFSDGARIAWFGMASGGFSALLGQSVALAGERAEGFKGFWTLYDSTADLTILYMDRDLNGVVSSDDLRIEFSGHVILSKDAFSTGTFFGHSGSNGPDSDTTLPLGPDDDQAFGLGGNDTLNGLAGNDILYGDAGDDVLMGGEDDDRLIGGNGNDTLRGDNGDDTLYGGLGNDSLEGGPGADQLFAANSPYQSWEPRDDASASGILRGGDGNDELTGSLGSDSLYGDTGSDQLYGGSGSDVLNGGDGIDYLKGDLGSDTLMGGDDSDTFAFDVTFDSTVAQPDLVADFRADYVDLVGMYPGSIDGSTTLWRGQANDGFTATIGQSLTVAGAVDLQFPVAEFWTFYNAATDTTGLFMDRNADFVVDANDFLVNFAGRVHLTRDNFYGGDFIAVAGSSAADSPATVPGTTDGDLLYGLDGKDTLSGAAGNDSLFGNRGDDELNGGPDHDSLYGGAGNDMLRGDGGNDILLGGLGDDTLMGGDGDDVLVAAGANNTNYDALPDSPASHNLLMGGAGSDWLAGSDGSDTLDGGAGSDELYGRDGNDRLVYDANDHTVDGGEGDHDVLVLISPETVNFSNAQDQVAGGGTATGFEDADFTAVGSGVSFIGSGQANRVWGSAYGDTLIGGAGNDSLHGGLGLDVAQYNGPRDRYTVTKTATGYTVTDTSGADGTDVLTGIERLVFADTTVALGNDVNLLAYTWKAHTLLSNVTITNQTDVRSTVEQGAAKFDSVTDSSMTLTASRAVPVAEATATSSAVNLQDAIAILKMIVGLPINAANQPLSPYQSLAADFDGNGTVGLNDAIGVLKHVVGLPSPDPVWRFVNDADTTIPSKAGLNPGTGPTGITVDVTGSTGTIGLVGYLVGDVDGSYAGANGALDLDLIQPDYFSSLVVKHPELTLAQFGVYGVSN